MTGRHLAAAAGGGAMTIDEFHSRDIVYKTER
jgi:hypothetical protein